MTAPDVRRAATTLVGTSGWQYRHWQRHFYPESMDPARWLGHYASQFACVEVSASFHELPDPDTLAAWRDATPDGFEFAVKAPRSITHVRKLMHCEDEVQTLLTRVALLGERLGPILFQLPSRWRCNLRRLAAFTARLPDAGRFAFEFRDPSWYCDEVYTLLEEHGHALCVHDLPGAKTPLEGPGPFIYARLHGPGDDRTGNYRTQTLRTWLGRAHAWNRKGKSAYVFFDSDERGFAVKNARRMLGIEREAAA